jgi:long-subunit fatty acid transport protein
MPWIFRTGVAVNPTDKSVIEFATVYQRWSMQKEIVVTDVNLIIENNPESSLLTESLAITDDVILPADYEDAWSFRLGGEAEVIEPLSVRAGGFYETSAIPEQTQSVALVDGPKFGYGLGLTYWHKKQERRVFSLDAGFSQTFISERTITGSQVRRQEIPVNMADALTGSLEANIVPGQAVGNGAFGSQLMFFSAGGTVYWGKSAANKNKKAKGGGKKKG